MVEKQKILSLYGSQSARSVARELGLNRKTVERYFREYRLALQSDDVDDVIDTYTSLKASDIANPDADQIKMYLSKADEIKTPTVADYSSVEYKEIEDKSVSTLASLTNIMNNKELSHDVRTY